MKQPILILALLSFTLVPVSGAYASPGTEITSDIVNWPFAHFNYAALFNSQ